ncbi:MAG: 3'-5' exonuclease [Clostridia bacterium]|nr:3'-5' exonuclease [Clostridia bacterium]
MTERFIVFDVETPNHENSRMCSIGITVIDDGEICDDIYYTVNPGTYFDTFNMMLTGITPETVCHSCGFEALWNEIGNLFSTGTLVAHNAPFDMSVLSKCIRDYGLPHPRCFEYVCTCRMARKCFPQLQNHKLDTLCGYLGIDLSHHNAASDSRACAELFLHMTNAGISPYDFCKSYDVLNCCTLKNSKR